MVWAAARRAATRRPRAPARGDASVRSATSHASRTRSRKPCCPRQRACHGGLVDEWPRSGLAHEGGGSWAATRTLGGPGHAAHHTAVSSALCGLKAAPTAREEPPEHISLRRANHTDSLSNLRSATQNLEISEVFAQLRRYSPLYPTGACTTSAFADGAGQQQPGKTD